MPKLCKLTWRGRQATAQTRRGVVVGLTKWAEYVLGEAVKIVPHDEGILQDTGRTYVDPENLEAAVVFDTPYAVVQHEDMTLTHLNGRKPKYLETPWLASADMAKAFVKTAVKRETGM